LKNFKAYVITAPFFLLFFLFLVLPLLMTFTTAFTDYKGAGAVSFAGFNNFVLLFGDTALLKNLGIAAVTAAAGFFAAVTLALFVSLMPWILRGVLVIALFIPFFSETYSLGIGFLAIFAGIYTIPPERREAARLEGMNRIKELFSVILPAIKPQILFAAVMQLAAITQSDFNMAAREYSAVFELGTASAASLAVFLPVLAVYFLLRKLWRCRDNG
jgi:multiple sugar transport system permease protein